MQKKSRALYCTWFERGIPAFTFHPFPTFTESSCHDKWYTSIVRAYDTLWPLNLLPTQITLSVCFICFFKTLRSSIQKKFLYFGIYKLDVLMKGILTSQMKTQLFKQNWLLSNSINGCPRHTQSISVFSKWMNNYTSPNLGITPTP